MVDDKTYDILWDQFTTEIDAAYNEMNSIEKSKKMIQEIQTKIKKAEKRIKYISHSIASLENKSIERIEDNETLEKLRIEQRLLEQEIIDSEELYTLMNSHIPDNYFEKYIQYFGLLEDIRLTQREMLEIYYSANGNIGNEKNNEKKKENEENKEKGFQIIEVEDEYRNNHSIFKKDLKEYSKKVEKNIKDINRAVALKIEIEIIHRESTQASFNPDDYFDQTDIDNSIIKYQSGKYSAIESLLDAQVHLTEILENGKKANELNKINFTSVIDGNTEINEIRIDDIANYKKYLAIKQCLNKIKGVSLITNQIGTEIEYSKMKSPQKCAFLDNIILRLGNLKNDYSEDEIEEAIKYIIIDKVKATNTNSSEKELFVPIKLNKLIQEEVEEAKTLNPVEELEENELNSISLSDGVKKNITPLYKNAGPEKSELAIIAAEIEKLKQEHDEIIKESIGLEGIKIAESHVSFTKNARFIEILSSIYDKKIEYSQKKALYEKHFSEGKQEEPINKTGNFIAQQEFNVESKKSNELLPPIIAVEPSNNRDKFKKSATQIRKKLINTYKNVSSFVKKTFTFIPSHISVAGIGSIPINIDIEKNENDENDLTQEEIDLKNNIESKHQR